MKVLSSKQMKEIDRRAIQELGIPGPTLMEKARYIINRLPRWLKPKGYHVKRHDNFMKLINPETGKVHNVSPHRLRDSFAVHAVKLNDSGDGLRLLQEQLGHVSFNTTAKYRKVAGDELKSWYDKLWSREVNQGGSQT